MAAVSIMELLRSRQGMDVQTPSPAKRQEVEKITEHSRQGSQRTSQVMAPEVEESPPSSKSGNTSEGTAAISAKRGRKTRRAAAINVAENRPMRGVKQEVGAVSSREEEPLAKKTAMMMQAPEMQEGANNAKNEERDATAARMVALRAKVAAKQLEEKQAAAKAREAARMEELRAK